MAENTTTYRVELSRFVADGSRIYRETAETLVDIDRNVFVDAEQAERLAESIAEIRGGGDFLTWVREAEMFPLRVDLIERVAGAR